MVIWYRLAPVRREWTFAAGRDFQILLASAALCDALSRNTPKLEGVKTFRVVPYRQERAG